MKPLLHRKFLCILSALLLSFNLYAQVTIGSGEPPVEHAILQIKDIDNAPIGDVNVKHGGLILPRVQLLKKHHLLPFVNISDTLTSSPEYPEYQNTKKPAHRGMIVYNMQKVDDEDLCQGLNQWDGEKWICFQQQIGSAVATINCNDISFTGQYIDKKSLDGGHTMQIKVTVTKIGAYTISATATQSDTSGNNTGIDNGYFFTISGIFLSKGEYILTVPGAGTPIKPTLPDNGSNAGDYISVKFNDKELCQQRLFIENSSVKPLYTMDCRTIKVFGTYIINQSLNPSLPTLQQYITMNIVADAAAEGASYIIKTNTIDGIYFEAKGKLVPGTQTITLIGYGTPTNTNDKYFTITSNSIKSVATCNAKITVLISKKRVIGIGTNETTFGWSPTIPGTGSYKVTKSPNNFGLLENSIVKVEEIDLTHLSFTGDIAGGINTIRGYLEGTNGQPPVDICIIAQDAYLRASEADYFANYVNKGGILIVFNEGNGYLDAGLTYPRGTITNLMKAIWGAPANTSIADFGFSRRVNYDGDSYQGYPGAIYPLTSVDDEILNGPFGDVRGKQWGEDASWARGVKNIPTEDIIIYSYATNLMVDNQDPEASSLITGFRHRYKNFVYFGDGGFVSSTINATNSPTNKSITICPFWWQAGTFTPAPKPNYGEARPIGGVRQHYYVYNSIIYCNIMAWALKQAEENGINSVL
ncbi:hypothetical protein JGH11_07225 [Dysgonomonas sp. Marseille-P4677]|uniref:hypothetical protein n=1 Tax=Dysgonomonas sp. Marseille-P4677 TaxID=2364790 RepID=UPI00191428BB|nr:hypothetical protein [Dysgonomonas sp. Marseille-P4677]MBK5720660.1 hypothetical protein [Dysgonomonas sp. Marseille-P4677]